MKSPDEILEDAHAYVRKINNGKIDPIAVTAYIEGYTNAWSIQQPVNMSTVSDGSPSESSFEQFWNLYDKKVARPKCEKLWQKLSKKEKELYQQLKASQKESPIDKFKKAFK